MNLDALKALSDKRELSERDVDIIADALPELIAAARRLEALEKAIADGKASMPAERAFDWITERAAAIAGKGGAA